MTRVVAALVLCLAAAAAAQDWDWRRGWGRGGRVPPRFATADSFDGDVFLTLDGIAGNYTVEHAAFFADCVSNCELFFTTSPK